jgi:hypothetical protein
METDCLEAIKLIGEKHSNLLSHARRISMIRERMRERETRVIKVSREANCASRSLAQLGRVDGRTTVWMQSFSPHIAAAMNSDHTCHLTISLFLNY